MIELVYSNKTEHLLYALAADLQRRRAEGAHPLDPVEMVVPNRNMETWVRLGLAQAAGISANLHFRRLERFIGGIVSEVCPGEVKLVDLDTIEAAILAVLCDQAKLERMELQPVKRYLESTVGLAGGLTPAGSSSTAGHGSSSSEGGRKKQNARAGFSAAAAFDRHLAADGTDMRRVQLSVRLAHLFQEYTYSRPEMIAAWRKAGGETGRSHPAGHLFANPAVDDPTLSVTAGWQRALWNAVFGQGGILENNPPADGGRWSTLDLLAHDDELFKKLKKTGLPPVHIFGVSYVARIFQHLFARLGEIGTLKIYTLNPCAEFWEDVETEREFFHRLDREMDRRKKRLWAETGETSEEDPFGLFEADNPALRYWGRPGREHVRLIEELTDCDFNGRFADPTGSGGGLLHFLQRDILFREPEHTPGQENNEAKKTVKTKNIPAAGVYQPDETIRLVAAPSVRREVEWVADEIWKLMRDDNPAPGQPPLRFSDIAVIVNNAGREVYLPQIETVFAACHNLPSSISDLPGTAGSRLIEAMSLLLKMPFGRFSRAEMLALMGHPAVIGSFENLTADDLAQKTEALGIIFGADHSDHAGTYIDEDVYNWDQGIRRLALGAFMTGSKSGDERIFEAAGGRWLVEEVSGDSASAAAQFGLLARSLIADARFVRKHEMTLTEWAGFYAAQIDAYLHVEDGASQRDRLRLLRALGKLEAMDLGHKVSGRTAAEIAGRAIESLGGGRGQYLAEGVVVSSFLPMRAIPFKAVFVLGLGEGLFPASGRRDALDLRSAKRRAGDVDTAERDRYMFLETLLCTREKLYLSYVRRDEQTGDPLQPSAVVQELMHILKNGYLGEKGVEALRYEPPLRRFDMAEAYRDTFIDEALVEARVLEIARSRQGRFEPEETGLYAAASTPLAKPGVELDAIRGMASPKAWEKFSTMLALPGEPPAPGAVTSAARSIGGQEEGAVEEPIDLSLFAVRRFLECPMQGWAAVMLGMTEVEEDPADREEEDFEVGRMLEATMLRDVFLDAAAGGFDPQKLYLERAEKLRLAGRVPVGALGKAAGKRHLDILEGWQSFLNTFPVERLPVSNETGGPGAVQRVQFGRSGRQGKSELALDPPAFSITPSNTGSKSGLVPVRLNGLTDGLFDNRRAVLTLLPKKPPSSKGKDVLATGFRYFLRGLVSQAALAAAGAAGSGERQILLCYSGGTGKTGLLKMRLKPLEPERARSWLKTVVRDLLVSAHGYLLPCEAVFLEYYEQLKTRSGDQKIKCGSLLPDRGGIAIEKLIDGSGLVSRIGEMVEDEWARFASLWGPVPSPRTYQPPPAEEAAGITLQRFGPLLEDIISIEAEGF